jgi:predicted ATP-dependent endonuclease of OLD family
MIIDEPEIHFHPQMQKRLIRMLEKMSTNIGTQFLVSTYSPIFINESNIANVYRFSKIKGNTEIKTPNNNILADESSLIQILKFENAAKIFFVDKIIMVEGEIDAYFFEYYLEYLHKFPKRKDKLTNYEIVNINGK